MKFRLNENTDHIEAAMELVKCGQSMGWLLPEEEIPLGLPDIDERMRMALVQLKEDLKNEKKNMKMYWYDYAWILHLIKECNEKKMPTFRGLCFDGVSDWWKYLQQLEIKGVGNISTLNEYYNLKIDGKFPDWRFKDEPDFNGHSQDKPQRRHCNAYERVRRINIVRRFLKLFRQYQAVAA